MAYGENRKVSASLYVNTHNIVVLLDDGKYDILTTNGDVYLGHAYIGIRSDQPEKVQFAHGKGLIQSLEPASSETAGYISIDHYATTEKMKLMAEKYIQQKIGEAVK